jgi:Fe-S cluster assembly protein SufD
MALAHTESNLLDVLSTKLKDTNFKRPEKFSALSEKAVENLKNHGLPNHKNEEYKYFNVLRKISKDYSVELPKTIPQNLDWVNSKMIDDDKGVHIVYINGVFSSRFSNLENPVNGFNLFDLDSDSDYLKDKILELFLEHKQNVNNDLYLDLNNAFLNAGFLLNLDKQFDPGRPVYIYHFVTDDIKDTMINKKGIIVLDKDSKADIVEIFYTENNNHYFRNYNLETYLKDGSLLNYYVIQETGNDSVCINNVNIYQSENSRANTYTFSLKGSYLRNNLNLLLNQENCESHLFGLYFISDKDLIDNHTTVDHKKPHCFSNEYYKGIINDNGTGTFNGKIYVRPNAQKTNAFQSNKNLVLTDNASINTKPQLEIWADDVKCSHGATTGQLDDEQLFYLRSRGLDKESATALLLHAFAFDIVDKVELEHLRKYIADKINLRLGYKFSE